MEVHPVGRDAIIETMRAILAADPAVRAAWLGGSDASGRTDRFSDIDLQAIVEDDRVEQVLARIHEGLERLSPIELRYRFPEPMWHGHSQELLRLRGADPNHFLDLVIMKRGTPGRLLEPERHGSALVLFDHDGLLVAETLDRAAHLARMEKRLADLRMQFPLYQPLVTRGIHRRQPAESAYLYQVATLKLLVELLRMRFCPARYDYGLRYLDRDLPPEWRRKIERLAFPASPAALLACQAQAAADFEDQIAALDRGEWTPGEGAWDLASGSA